MSDPSATADVVSDGPATAGRLLREARERQGLHIAALAASIKVTPKKLEALEADRFDALPDATFTRALAQTVCRALKIDSVPIMRLLPPLGGYRLEQVGEGLNAPFRARSGALVQRDRTAGFRSPAFWVTVVILAAALAVYFVPRGITGLSLSQGAASAPAARASAVAASAVVDIRGELPGMPPEVRNEDGPAFIPAPGGVAPVGVPPAEGTRAPVAPVVAGAATSAPVGTASAVVMAPAPVGLLQVQTSASSWVMVNDGRGRSLVARQMKPGEAIGVDGVLPLKVRIGNSTATRLTFRGQPQELASHTRDNVASLELK